MHYYEWNHSKRPYMCIVWSPPEIGNLNDPCLKEPENLPFLKGFFQDLPERFSSRTESRRKAKDCDDQGGQ